MKSRTVYTKIIIFSFVTTLSKSPSFVNPSPYIVFVAASRHWPNFAPVFVKFIEGNIVLLMSA